MILNLNTGRKVWNQFFAKHVTPEQFHAHWLKVPSYVGKTFPAFCGYIASHLEWETKVTGQAPLGVEFDPNAYHVAAYVWLAVTGEMPACDWVDEPVTA